MKLQVLDFGYEHLPTRKHYNDAGADVYAKEDVILQPHTTTRIGLGFGLIVPDGYAGYVYPRSGLASEGIVCELPPIDSGYRGEIHAIVTNITDHAYEVTAGDRIGQLVVTPIVIVEFITDSVKERGDGAFASTGR